MSDNIDQGLKDALHFGEDADWRIGMPDVDIGTKSGAIYKMRSDGTVWGGSKDIEGAELNGAVYRGGGPIRVNEVVIGMSMEICWKEKVLTTSTVVALVYRKEKK